MKRLEMRTSIIIFLCLVSLYSCNERNKNNTSKELPVKDSISITKTNKHLSIDDSLFVFKGIQSTECIEKCVWDNNKLFVDSIKKTALVLLDNKEKLSILSEILKMDTAWIKQGIFAYYVSKQEKIGRIQPIIIKVEGLDYSSLLLVLTDETGNIISEKILFGGEAGGPDEVSDTLVIFTPVSRCCFNKNEIKTHSTIKIINPKLENPRQNSIPAKIDSINYLSIIDSKGNIETKKIDSTRYDGIIKW